MIIYQSSPRPGTTVVSHQTLFKQNGTSMRAKITIYLLASVSSLELFSVPYPISFAIPESKIVATVPTKQFAFASLIPGDLKTYIYQTEQDYYQGYQQAYFGLTWKKGGWDCMRHYEILANGCIPYFPNLENCPTRTMTKLPKQLILQAMQLPGVGYNAIDFTKFDYQKYHELAQQLLTYTREHLTTRKLAQYLLKTLNYSGQGKILFLAQNDAEDYLKACVLIGLKEELQDKVIDYPRVHHIYQDYAGDLSQSYGRGFSFTRIVPDYPVDRTKIAQRIQAREFELIIYGYIHHGRDFYALVQRYYSPAKIAYLCGQDAHRCQYAHLPNLFLRESEADPRSATNK